MKKIIFSVALALMACLSANAQRYTDTLNRGLVAVKTTSGVYVSWRIQASEYFDVKYNLYRDGQKVNAEPLNVSNYTDASGSASSRYTVKAVVGGVEQEASKEVAVLSNNYKSITLKHDASLKSTYIPNDACCADVDGDGEVEILLKLDNQQENAQLYPKNGPTINGVETKEYSLLECIKQDGTLLWWVNCGPNMGDFQNNEQNIVGYDWDMDGKAEVVMRLEEGSEVHMADGTVYTIGADGKNGTSWTNYRTPKVEGSVEWFTYYGKEFLWYCEGATGKPYQCIDYPLKRLETDESDLKTAWGDGYGHRSNKHFFGAPYLDGKHPSIFIGRGIYTRHKFIAYDVNPETHSLTTRWTWTNNQAGSPWYGQGYHNYTIADVDWDGRDEIVWGSMVIDDNGMGLSTTGLGHGDAQHVSDLNPYVHGQEVFACNEDAPANNYRDATTSKIYYRLTGESDAGRALAGNFYNDIPGAIGNGAHDTPISTVINNHVNVNTNGLGMNFRIYWDGDLQEECFDNITVSKPGVGTLATFSGCASNNSTKATPCYQGDIFGDWREEVIERNSSNPLEIRIYTTTTPTEYRNYSLWYDHQYRNAMVWQPCGYNQPPHASYFLGELEGITIAPPPLTLSGREEVTSTVTTSQNSKQVLLDATADATVTVADGASPSVFIDNAPSWVQGSAPSECTTKETDITYTYYTHTLTGGAFTGAMRLVKQGDGTLVLPNVIETYTGNTDIWAGKLSFNGTMQSSPVWLNRFAELNSNGGIFNGGIKADYGSVIRPGGEKKVGAITTSDLQLGFGARVVFDIDGTNCDVIKATAMSIEKKDWQNGPEYSTPVFEFTSLPAAGTYTLAEVSTLTGNVSDIAVEGLTGKKYTLAYSDGKITITVTDGRSAEENVTWTGANGSTWDLMNTENFTSSDKQFVSGDGVVFDDNAATTSVTIEGSLSPSSIVFNNDTKDYTLSGDGSIEGTARLTVQGSGTVNINNTNKYSGGTYINGGTLIPTTLANSEGADYGSLGGVKNSIRINNNATLKTVSSITTSQPIIIYNNGATINTTGTLILSNAITENNAADKTVLHKAGSGTLQLNSSSVIGVDTIYVDAGTLYDFGDAHFNGKTIMLNGGTMSFNNSIYSYSGENATFVVPSGKISTLYPDGRCDYTGKLLGAGTLNLHATWVRCPFKGDWSNFTGIIKAYQDGTVGSYTPSFDFNNTYGIGKAELNIQTGCTVHTNGKNFAIGALKGSGAIDNSGAFSTGTNTLSIGGRNVDFAFTGTISGSNIKKVGIGKWTVSKESILASAGKVTVTDGILFINLITANSSLTGTAGTTVSGGTLAGVGLVSNLTLENGGAMRIGTNTSATSYTSNNKNIRVSGNFNARAGSDIYFNIVNTGTENITSRSYIIINSANTTPVVNGNVHLTYKTGLQMADGMTFTLIELPAGVQMSGSPIFDLQALPDGLAWDTTDFLATGKVKVVNGTGILNVTADFAGIADIYTISGTKVATINTTAKNLAGDMKSLGLAKGLYVARTKCGCITVMIK